MCNWNIRLVRGLHISDCLFWGLGVFVCVLESNHVIVTVTKLCLWILQCNRMNGATHTHIHIQTKCQCKIHNYLLCNIKNVQQREKGEKKTHKHTHTQSYSITKNNMKYVCHRCPLRAKQHHFKLSALSSPIRDGQTQSKHLICGTWLHVTLNQTKPNRTEWEREREKITC